MRIDGLAYMNNYKFKCPTQGMCPTHGESTPAWEGVKTKDPFEESPQIPGKSILDHLKSLEQ